MLMLISKTLFSRIFIELFTRRNFNSILVFGKRPKDLRTGPKALTYKTAAYKVTKLSALFMFRIHFIRCAQAFAFKTRATHSMNQKEDVTLTPY